MARGMTISEAMRELGVYRQFPWQISHGSPGVTENRRGFMTKIAWVIMEPVSKLMFVAGYNPWVETTTLQEQVAIWEFVERLVLVLKGKDDRQVLHSMLETMLAQMPKKAKP